MRRFYAPKENIKNSKIKLDADETRHLRDVLRFKEGEKVQVFDGENAEFLCVIETINKRETVLDIIEEIKPSIPKSNLDLTLAVAILKGDKFDLAIQKAVELGVTKFVPLNTKRCDVKLKNSDKKVERWRKIIIESSKQCGRADLMEIVETNEFTEFVKSANGTQILFSENGGAGFDEISESKKITALIGSEGGWEESEIEFARENDFQIITFGGRILRAETAVISITTVLQHRFGDLK